QLHLAYEFTAGVTPSFAIGVIPLTARRPGNGFDFAGWKVLPHVYAPAAWHLPVAVGVVAEFSFLTATYDQDPASIEIHPVVEKRAGNFLLDANPSLGHTLKGPGREDGWIFAPSLCVRYTKSNRVIPHLEYYDQPTRFHHVIGGADMRIGENLLL